jgi:hypothetical protein
MAFLISFVNDNALTEKQDDLKLGKIILGDYEEHFEASLSYWSMEDYLKHWEYALHRIAYQSNKSCLITSMYNPRSSNYLYWWPMYKDGSSVFIQNQILFLKNIKPKFDPNNPYLSVPDRKTMNEEGHEISEWELSIEEILEYLRLL